MAGNGQLNLDESTIRSVVEEVVRILGYEGVPLSTLSTPIPLHEPDPLLRLREQMRDLLVDSGMQEVITYPLVSSDMVRKAQVGESTGEEQTGRNGLLRMAAKIGCNTCATISSLA